MRITQKITAVFLAALFLVSSLGFSVSRMACLKSGRVMVSLAHAGDCCPGPRSQRATVKENCCDIVTQSLHLADFQNAQKYSVVNPAAALPLFNRALPATIIAASVRLRAGAYTDLPPPRYGRSLLHFISVLTI